MSCQGVFFDLYGTLLVYHDLRAAWADWLDACYESLCPGGMPYTREEFAQHCDGLFSGPEPPAGQDNLTVYERRIRSLAVNLHLPLPRVDIAQAATASVSAWQKYVTLDPEAIPTLNSLKATKTLALITNFDHPPHLHTLLDDLGLRRFFTTILISGETGFKKPHPFMFAQALKQTGLPPAEVVYVGDTADDTNGARAAGIRPIYLTRNDDDNNRMISDFKSDLSFRAEPEEQSFLRGVTVISGLAQLAEMLE